MPLLHLIQSPAELKKLSPGELAELAGEIRKEIVSVVQKNGGHLSSNLGVVELTIALHRVFDSPQDAIVFDVSHQCYTHKLLTGRYERFATIRQRGGLSGFTKPSESEHDFFNWGHASNSISAALGMLMAKQITGKDGKVVAVIGDGALTGGLAVEALSHAGQLSKNLIVVLNDNQLSIGPNTGSVSKHLSRLTMTPHYQTFRNVVDWIVDRIPVFGRHLQKFIFRFKRGLKGLLLTNNVFSDLGFEYAGPLDGHNIAELEAVFKRVKKLRLPVVVHVVTRKGKGWQPAEADPVAFHGVSGAGQLNAGIVEGEGEAVAARNGSAPLESGMSEITFTEAFSRAMLALAAEIPNLAAITAAMVKGTGLAAFAKACPERFFDVGIAEGHAAAFAAGLARQGVVPVAAIYSTFMQRAVDQVIHDAALQNLPVIFAIDRAGAVPDDGETHQGIFDIPLMLGIPNMTLLAPASAAELELCLRWAASKKSPSAIRYPKSNCPAELPEFSRPLEEGRGVLIKCKCRGQGAGVSGQGSGDSGQWSVVSGKWSVVSGKGAVDSGKGSVVSGRWSVDSGKWSVDSGKGSVDSGKGLDSAPPHLPRNQTTAPLSPTPYSLLPTPYLLLTTPYPLLTKHEAKEIYSRIGTRVNKQTGQAAEFVKSSFRKIIGHDGFDNRIIGVLAEAYERAVFMYDEPVNAAHKTHTNFTGYSHYAAEIEIDGSPVYARFTLERLRTKPGSAARSQFHSVHISQEKKYTASPRVNSNIITMATWGASSTDSKLSQWLNFVKGANGGQWSVDSGQWSVDSGRWSGVSGKGLDSATPNLPRNQTAAPLLPTPYSLLPTPYPLLTTPYSVLLVCTGGIFPETLAAARILEREGIFCDIYNLRFLKPIDEAYFRAVASAYTIVVFAEDGVVMNGIGRRLEHILKTAAEPASGGMATAALGFPDRFLAQGKRAEILEDAGLSPEAIAGAARSIIRESRFF